jgi:prolyl-tRNA synthetase
MKQSQLFYKTLKESPKEEKSLNARLLIRGGFISKEMAGVWSYLPLGLRVLKNIEKIIREEMGKIGGQETLMSILQPKEIWMETGRWEKEIGKIMYKVKEEEKEIGLGPTHEEMITDIVRKRVNSWQDLPLYLYQIQNKFRKEPRPRSGLLRGREFLMKDLYSFHSSQKDFEDYYGKVKKAYLRVFERCGLEALLTEASGEGFTEGYTHEFQVLAEGGEDKIIFCPAGAKKIKGGHFSQNKEIARLKKGQKCPVCGEKLEEGKSIEVGNIFPLGTKYSGEMKAFFTDRQGKKKPIVMGCYGIGISRMMGAAVEVHRDEKGIIWPKEIAPFKVHLIPIELSDSKVMEVSERIYGDLQEKGFQVLYDDRKEKRAGEKFAEADLIGLPWRIVVSKKTVARNSLELKERSKEKTGLVKIKEVMNKINA